MPVRRVLLVPGIWMPGWSMRWIARALARDGFDVRCSGYAGVLGGPERVLPALRQALDERDAVVAHSLGGLMTLEALRGQATTTVRRVVCLGSPLSGSAVAAGLAQQRLGWAVGRSGPLLAAGIALPWASPAKVGAVAGTRSRGVGRLLGHVGAASDGTVALAETRWAGLDDHAIVPASHAGLLVSPPALAQVVAYLRHGRFETWPHGE